MSKLPIVAIVGRANVGKSSLYNAILGRREAIVADEPGTTRDSIATIASYQGRQFWLTDTAGIKTAEDDFELTIQEQIEEAAASADVIWVVVEANVMITEEDRRVAKMALKSTKPVFLIINKIDQARKDSLDGFLRLGIKDIFRTSATHREGIDELLGRLVKEIPKVSSKPTSGINLALLGRPNVGKSALFNALGKKQQAIVSARAGTTRDINRAAVTYHQKTIELMDTAGIRRAGKIERGVEHFSVLRSLAAIEQADVCLLLIDVNEPSTSLDQKIAGMIKDAGKGLILVVSKWDSLEDKTPFSRDQLAAEIVADYDFVPWAPLIFTSSVTGQNVTKIFDLTLEIIKNRKIQPSTSQLNTWLRKAVSEHPPAGLKNRDPKLNYMVQETDNTSTVAFKIFGSQTKFVHWSYRRYLERKLREAFGYQGTPIQLWFIEKHIAHKSGAAPTQTKPKPPRK